MAGTTCLHCSDNFIVNTKYTTCNYCENKYHIQCVKIKDAVSKFVSENENFKWFCDKCLEAVTQKLKSTSVDSLPSVDLQLVVKENDCLHREINLLKKIVSDQDYVVNLQKEKLASLSAITVSTPTLSSHSSGTAISYSEAIKNHRKQNNEEAAVLFIKSNSNIKPANMSNEIKSTLNPASLHINIKNTKPVKNGMLITCDSSSSLEKLKTNLENKIGNKYAISENKKRLPRLIIRGVEKEYAERQELVNDIIGQNNLECSENDIKVITKITNKYTVNIVVEVTSTVRTHIMNTGLLFIGWRRCAVADHLNIIRCFQCSRFNHVKSDCKGVLTCPRCSDNHELKDCTSEIEKCINCISHNLRNKANLSTNHSAKSTLCHMYKQKVEALINTIDYNG